MIPDDQSLKIAFHLINGFKHHLNAWIINRVHLAVKFKAYNPIAHVDEACVRVGFHTLTLGRCFVERGMP